MMIQSDEVIFFRGVETTNQEMNGTWMEYEWEIDGLSYFIAMESMEYNRLDIWNIMEYEWNIMWVKQ